ncbi:MAG: metalloregulator ArsR/SmtB family transcription factor [Terracidiphilus sp.]|jgi:DNA-binding transcriptional ArsR family regulator
MSPKIRSRSRSRTRARRPQPAILFAALGDATRLALIGKLSSGQPASIAQLTAGSRLTRQAISKHLRVLERAGLVRSVRAGRESRIALDPHAIEEMQKYLAAVSRRWDQALARLKAFVED